MKRLMLLILAIVVAGAVGLADACSGRREQLAQPAFTTRVVVTSGPVVESVQATGTWRRSTPSRSVRRCPAPLPRCLADFNWPAVNKGQVLARLEPSLFQTQVDRPGHRVSGCRQTRSVAAVEVEDARRSSAAPRS